VGVQPRPACIQVASQSPFQQEKYTQKELRKAISSSESELMSGKGRSPIHLRLYNYILAGLALQRTSIEK